MRQDHTSLLEKIDALPEDWHGAGSVTRPVLQALAKHCDRIEPVRCSVETGAGRTTLLLSNISERHLVFAKDCGQSLSRTRASALLRAEHVEFIEGPTQKTLPAYEFTHGLQLALIDGPHGYPLPDLEYYYLYPHIESGGLLVLDDTNIPTIGRMLDILRADAMYDLAEIVNDTAFLVRTDAPAIDPCDNSWWLQGYNARYYERITTSPSRSLSSRLRRLLTRDLPKAVTRVIPSGLKASLGKKK